MSSEIPDQSEFVRCYNRHYRDLYRYAFMLVLRQSDADDVLQEASVALWKKFDQFDPELPFLPWAKRFVFLEVLNFRKRKKGAPIALSDSVIEQLGEENSAHEDVLAVQREALEGCVAKLKSRDREMLEARYDSETSLVELANSSNRSVNSMYVILNRIRKQLLQCVNRVLRSEGIV